MSVVYVVVVAVVYIATAVCRENGETTLEVKAPDTITSWVATAFAMHRESGLGITPTASKVGTTG